MFSQAAKLHSKISHPYIIKLNYSFRIKSESLFVILLELADGSLESEIKTLTQTTAVSYFLQIMEALRYLHDDLHIVHKNLKPRNILIKQGAIKLSDIKMPNRGFTATTYLPPEVLNGNKYNEKSDIWAAGVVLHEMLSHGKHPFDPKGTQQQAEIVENVKVRNSKFDEDIQDPKCLEFWKVHLYFCFIYFSFFQIDCLNFDELKRFSAAQILKLMQVNLLLSNIIYYILKQREKKDLQANKSRKKVNSRSSRLMRDILKLFSLSRSLQTT